MTYCGERRSTTGNSCPDRQKIAKLPRRSAKRERDSAGLKRMTAGLSAVIDRRYS